jgi:hypothetical protein
MSIAENVPASVRLGNDILFGNIDAFGKAFEQAQRNIKEFSRINTNTQQKKLQ